MHATRRASSGQAREMLSNQTRLDEASVDMMLRLESSENRTHEGKFRFLTEQKKHQLTPSVSITLSTQKLDTQHPGYQRPKVPLQTMLAHKMPHDKPVLHHQQAAYS